MLQLEMERDKNSMLANVFVDEVSNSSLIKKCFAKALWLEDKHKELSVDGAAEIVTLPFTAYIRAASDEIHTMKCSTLPTIASPTPVIILTFLIYLWLHPKDPPAEKKLVGDWIYFLKCFTVHWSSITVKNIERKRTEVEETSLFKKWMMRLCGT